MPIRIEEMRKTEGLDPDKTVIFFAVGPIEDHGPHLPSGLDFLEARELCKRLAEKTENDLKGWVALLMPPVPLGVDSNTTAFAITVRGYVLRDYLVDTCLSLATAGFYRFVCVSGNLGPRQLTAIEEAGRILGRKKGWFFRGKRQLQLLSASSGLVSFDQFMSSPISPSPSEHGGKMDTAVALALGPELVDPVFTALSEVPKWSSVWSRLLAGKGSRKISGYWGDPHLATAEAGSLIIGDKTERLYGLLKPIWLGENKKGRIRSWYSLVPTNTSYFKVWLLFSMIFLMFLAWVFISFKDVVPR